MNFSSEMERVHDNIFALGYGKQALQNGENYGYKNSFRRYMMVSAPAMAVYLVATLGISWGEKILGFSMAALYGLSLVPILALFVAMWGHWRHIGELDEYLRDVQIKGMMFGLAIVLSVSATWGLFEILANAPRLKIFYTSVVFCVGYSGAVMFLTFLNRKKSHEE